jgi:type IV pilus assembly protein PilM
MFSSRAIVIDCGASRTTLGVFSRRSGRLRLDHFAEEIFLIAPGHEEEWLAKTGTALRTLRERTGVVGPVMLVLPAHLTLTKFVAVPPVAAAKRAKVIEFEVRQNIPYDLAGVVWDSVVTDSRESGADAPAPLDVMVCAAKREPIDAICAAAKAAGFIPRMLLPAPLALLAAYRATGPATDTATLLINLGARSAVLVLAEPHRCFARSVSLAGNFVTQQIVESQDFDFADAEALKLSAHNRHLVEPAAAALAARVAQEVTRTVLHFQRRSGALKPARVVLTGGTACLPGVYEMLKAKLAVPVAPLDAPGAVEISHGAAKGNLPARAAVLADLVGGAVLASPARRGQFVLNLLPAHLRAHGSLRRRQTWLGAAAALAVAAFVPFIAHYREVVHTARRKTASIERELASLRERDARNRANLQKLAELRKQMAAFRGVQERRAAWLRLFADLEERLVRTEDVWLDRVQLGTPAPADAGAQPCLVVSARMLDHANSGASANDVTHRRVRDLLASIAGSPYVAGLGRERFDASQPGVLRFDFEFRASADHPF